MKHLTILNATLFVVLADKACGVAVPAVNTFDKAVDPSVDGMGRVPVRYVGSPTAGGPKIDFTGTADELLVEIMKLYPHWRPSFSTKSPVSKRSTLIKRYFKGPPVCSNGPWADRYTILNHAVPFLKELTMSCEIPARSCGYTYCAPAPTPGAGVMFCNQKSTALKVSCKKLGEAAEMITNRCPAGGDKVSGMWTNTDGYAVVVRGCR